MSPTLLGELGGHARGKTLIAALGATAGDPPSSGVALAFGKEAQLSAPALDVWVTWAQEPGRVLVLMPPFQRGVCAVPTDWEARRAEPLAGGETELGRVLARDRQHELRGELIPQERVGGQVVTACWRRHPAAGLVVITALPLWSLIVLDHNKPLQDWVDEQVKQAGAPRRVASSPAPVSSPFSPGPDDWTLLLHLCTGPFPDPATALAALERSNVHSIEGPRATRALQRLIAAGLVEGGALNAAGEGALRASPFAAHARALRRMHHG
jgi:hypothetical protein